MPGSFSTLTFPALPGGGDGDQRPRSRRVRNPGIPASPRPLVRARPRDGPTAACRSGCSSRDRTPGTNRSQTGRPVRSYLSRSTTYRVHGLQLSPHGRLRADRDRDTIRLRRSQPDDRGADHCHQRRRARPHRSGAATKAGAAAKAGQAKKTGTVALVGNTSAETVLGTITADLTGVKDTPTGTITAMTGGPGANTLLTNPVDVTYLLQREVFGETDVTRYRPRAVADGPRRARDGGGPLGFSVPRRDLVRIPAARGPPVPVRSVHGRRPVPPGVSRSSRPPPRPSMPATSTGSRCSGGPRGRSS